MTTLTFESKLVVEVCINCGVQFAIPEELHAECVRRRAGKPFYCPSGHQQWFSGESDADKAARLARELAHTQEMLRSKTAAQEKAQAQAKRLRKRIANGVCPCCHRTFKQLAAHMKTQHPEYATA